MHPYRLQGPKQVSKSLCNFNPTQLVWARPYGTSYLHALFSIISGWWPSGCPPRLGFFPFFDNTTYFLSKKGAVDFQSRLFIFHFKIIHSLCLARNCFILLFLFLVVFFLFFLCFNNVNNTLQSLYIILQVK